MTGRIVGTAQRQDNGRSFRGMARAARASIGSVLRLPVLQSALDFIVERLASVRCPQRLADYDDYVFDFNTDFSDYESGIRKARKALDENGIIIIKNYFSPAEVQPLTNDIAAFADSIDEDVRERREYESEKFVLTYRGGKLQDRHPPNKSWVFVQRDDGNKAIDHSEGIIHVGETSLLFPNHQAFYDKIASAFLAEFIGHKMTPNRTFVNRSIAKTRGFHVDAPPGGPLMRDGIIYLTDVNSVADGPYCFARGTHSNWPLRQINHFINTKLGYGPANDLRLFSKKRVATVLGKAGTMLISTPTHGIHRGQTQECGHSRIALFLS